MKKVFWSESKEIDAVSVINAAEESKEVEII